MTPSKERDYAAKRAFDDTPEPPPQTPGNVDPTSVPAGKSFVIQQHHARRLHFDLRLEMFNGEIPVLVSWAVPRNLPTQKGKPHLAVHVEDHPIEYATFAGTIPDGQYGAGEVRIFDTGTYEMLEQESEKLTFRLHGNRLKGVYHLIRPRNQDKPNDWLVFLRADERGPRDEIPTLDPMFATLASDPFDSDEWIYEVKWDGVRALAVCADETLLLSRNKRDITATYPEFERLHERTVALDSVLDGEIVAMADGRPSFERLQARMNLQNPRDIQRMMKQVPVVYIAFDLLYLDGMSLMDRPVEERKRLLSEIVIPAPNVLVSDYVDTEGTALFEAARSQGLEGIVAKRMGSPYRPGRRTREWIKVKTVYDGDVVVGGWSRGEGSRSASFGALLVGAYTDEGLRLLGAVGTGFSERALGEMLPKLRAVESRECPFEGGEEAVRAGRFGKPIIEPHWAEPVLVARIEYREVTSGGRLRAPSFKALRGDKDAGDCLFEDLPGAAGA
ncbi:MAG: non-homologous end-joining DNA ligase [Actinomycetota bacterium]